MHQLVHQAAQLSALAYLDSPEVYINKGYQDVCHVIDEETSTEAFVMEDDTYIFVVFPGTEPDEGLQDIITDIRFANKKQFHKMRLHRGFWEAWASIAAPVAEEVMTRLLDKQDGTPPKIVVYTGHSLGGALAAIGAAAHNPQHCITFGQPHVGGRQFVKHINSMDVVYTRVVNNQDPVPSLLSWSPFYKHGGDLLFIDNNADVHQDPGFIRRLWSRGFFQFEIKDHNIHAYELLCYINAGELA